RGSPLPLSPCASLRRQARIAQLASRPVANVTNVASLATACTFQLVPEPVDRHATVAILGPRRSRAPGKLNGMPRRGGELPVLPPPSTDPHYRATRVSVPGGGRKGSCLHGSLLCIRQAWDHLPGTKNLGHQAIPRRSGEAVKADHVQHIQDRQFLRPADRQLARSPHLPIAAGPEEAWRHAECVRCRRVLWNERIIPAREPDRSPPSSLLQPMPATAVTGPTT